MWLLRRWLLRRWSTISMLRFIPLLIACRSLISTIILHMLCMMRRLKRLLLIPTTLPLRLWRKGLLLLLRT